MKCSVELKDWLWKCSAKARKHVSDVASNHTSPDGASTLQDSVLLLKQIPWKNAEGGHWPPSGQTGQVTQTVCGFYGAKPDGDVAAPNNAQGGIESQLGMDLEQKNEVVRAPLRACRLGCRPK